MAVSPSTQLTKLFVTGIGTDVGKTIVAALLVKALSGHYWKPIQTGSDSQSDTKTVQALTHAPIFEEYARLKAPLSPHSSAELEGVTLSREAIVIPRCDTPLVIEGAGGIYVPINDTDTMLDLIVTWGFPVVLVSRYYLGSINHTLLSVRTLEALNIKVLGIITNGDKNTSSEKAIFNRTKIPFIYHVPSLQLDGTVSAEREFLFHAQELKKALLNNCYL